MKNSISKIFFYKVICFFICSFLVLNSMSAYANNVFELSYVHDKAFINLNNSVKSFQTNISKSGTCQVSIKNNSSKVTIKSVNKNIFDGKFDYGYLTYNSNENLTDSHLKRYKTTSWMKVNPGDELTISGDGVNRNLWQFKNHDGNHYSFSNKATVTIPADIEWARVYYSKNISGKVQIEYGPKSTSYEVHLESSVTLPELKGSDVLYQDESFKWNKNKNGKNIGNYGLIKCYDTKTTFIVSGSDIGNITIKYLKKPTSDKDSYGVKWSLFELTEKCERLEGAAGLIAGSIEGNSPIANDFDFIYPWSDIKLCNIDSNENIIYQGDRGFAFDGSKGNVFVELPKWYVKRYQDASYEYLYISKTQKEGYEIEPAFKEGLQILDKIYIATYDGYVTDGKLVSRSGTYPTTNLSLKEYREYAKANGSIRYGVLDIRTIIALQHLYLVEFSSKNSSKTIGMGLQKMQYPFTKEAAVSENNVNRIILTNGEASEFKVGQSCAVSEKEDYKMEHRLITAIEKFDDLHMAIYFSGNPYDIKQFTTYIYNTPLASGMCDQMASPSGYASGDIKGNGFTSVRYRFVENPWGNIWNCVDGVVIKNNVPAICYDMTKYTSGGSEDYLPLNYTLPEQMENGNTNTYVNQIVKNLGFDSRYPSIGFPVEIAGGANKDNSFGDSWYCGKADLRELRWKGAWDLGVGEADRAGLFMLRAWFGIDETYWHDGARLMYKPIKIN